MWRQGGGKTNLHVKLFHGPQQKYTTCQGHQYDVIPVTFKQATRDALSWRKAKPNMCIYTYIKEGAVKVEWGSPSLYGARFGAPPK